MKNSVKNLDVFHKRVQNVIEFKKEKGTVEPLYNTVHYSKVLETFDYGIGPQMVFLR